MTNGSVLYKLNTHKSTTPYNYMDHGDYSLTVNVSNLVRSVGIIPTILSCLNKATKQYQCLKDM